MIKKLIFLFPILLTLSCASTDAAYWVEQGNQFMVDGKYDKAVESYAQMLTLENPDKSAYAFLANAYMGKYMNMPENASDTEKAEIFKKAEESFEKAVEMLEETMIEFEKSIEQLEASGKTNEASRKTRVLETNIRPKLADLLYRHGRLNFETANYVKAISLFGRALSVDASNLFILYWYAMTAEQIASGDDEPEGLKKSIKVWELFLGTAGTDSMERQKYNIKDQHIDRAKKGIKILEEKLSKVTFKDE